MTETVLTALITLAAGLGGAMVGALATYKTAKMSLVKSEKVRAYSALMTAYQSLLSDISATGLKLSPTSFDEEAASYTNFQIAYSRAVLVASSELIPVLNDLLKVANTFAKSRQVPESMHRIYVSAVEKMRADIKRR